MTGDKGTTSLVGGQRTTKNDPRLEAYGTVDELNAHIGLLRQTGNRPEDDALLLFIQNKLFCFFIIHFILFLLFLYSQC